VAVVAGAGVIVGVADPLGGTGHPAAVTSNAYPAALAPVSYGPLSSETAVNATLGYAGSSSVVNQARGTFTWLPAVGSVIRRGQVLYRVSGSPVVLLYGLVPAYRSLSEGMSGADVRQLNADLVALGYASRAQLDPNSDYFSAETAYALENFQEDLGTNQTGTLTLGQAVFLPSAARITTVHATLGTAAGPDMPALSASSTAREVTIALDAALQSQVKAGDKVTITLPDTRTTPGLVTSVGTVASASSSGGSSTVTVHVTPSNPAATGGLDQAPVQVSIITASVRNALAVPVNALLALAGGGYAVEVAGVRGARRLVPVTLGLFDDAVGLVQVSGAGLAAGQRVTVPAS
jgi:hypothetical protein